MIIFLEESLRNNTKHGALDGILRTRRENKTMTIWVTKKDHYKNRYLLNWMNPETGCMMGDWFPSIKELREYTQDWFITKEIWTN